ncbi:MAG: hypothetical protein KDK90_25135 [Leptospiraceae bacterium]|nr:hypothetical protein [Leptospiraceae bacterium]
MIRFNTKLHKKYLWNKVGFCLIVIVSSGLYSQEPKKISIAWKKVPRAISYKVEVKNELENIVFEKETKETSVDVILPPGKYQKRVSIIDKTSDIHFAEWSPLEIISKTVNEQPKTKIPLEWKEIPNATSYVVEIKDQDNKVVAKEKTTSTKIEIELPPGKYKKRIFVQVKTKEYIPSEWSDLELVQKKSFWQKHDVVIRSLAFPGWGQVYAAPKYQQPKYRPRGYIYMSLSALLLGFYFYNRNEYSKEQKEFQQLANNSILFSTLGGNSLYNIQDAYNFYIMNQLNAKQNHANKISQRGSQALAAILLIYTIQLLDSIKIQYFDLPKLSANVTKKDNLFPEYYYTIALEFDF